MTDIFNAIMLCDNCGKKTEKCFVVKGGCKLRAWKCEQCHKQWIHPKDLKEFEDFQELKRKHFEVKLRQVGNSWAVSIPKEIIRFEDVTATKTIRMNMDEPGKVSIFFTKIRKVIK